MDPNPRLRIIHTADWHLGRELFDKKRLPEMERFLKWLAQTLFEERVDVLLVAGDVFDSVIPPIQAQSLLMEFLATVWEKGLRHVVIIGGNHDSAHLLDALAPLLGHLRIHVVGGARQNPEDEVLALRGKDGEVELVVAAVPYLRDADVRLSVEGESAEERERRLREGIAAHYARVGQRAQQLCELEVKRGRPRPPCVALGHLFTREGMTQEGDGVRELYVGGQGHVDAGIFPDVFDYVALGHLHVPQTVAGQDHIRYSGSPIPMGFGEAGQSKNVILVEFFASGRAIRELPVPVFQNLQHVRGSIDNIKQKLQRLRQQGFEGWVLITHDGPGLGLDLHEQVERLVAGAPFEVLRVQNPSALNQLGWNAHTEEELGDLDEINVFEALLQSQGNEWDEATREELRRTYREALEALRQEEEQGGAP